MNAEASLQPGFWQTVRLLLGASRKRAAGRQKRQRELLRNRTGKAAVNWGGLTFLLGILFGIFLNGMAAMAVYSAVISGAELDAGRGGQIVVSRWFLNYIHSMESYYAANPKLDPKTTKEALDDLDSSYAMEARNIARDSGEDQQAIAGRLRAAFKARGSRGFVTRARLDRGLKALPTRGSFPSLLGSTILLWWGVMLVCQGEGLELDLQRRRHPMWEWLFSHPVPPGAVFLAELLSPIVANPIYLGAPVFAGLLYGGVYGVGPGIATGFVVGVPAMVAAACLGKALEIAITLRFAPRSRGAMIGLMSWLGYASLMLMMVVALEMAKIVPALGFLGPLTAIPCPWLGLFLGQRADGSFSMLQGIVTCWLVAGVTVFAAVRFSIWGAEQGLSGNFGSAPATVAMSKKLRVPFGKDPLYRKELLWFMRDRSAIVQTILIPLTVAGYQLFNMRGLLSLAANGWNSLCGVGILFGTYFLWILGPKSLSSEGNALWIALTWPRGLENLLKAKAWLWTLISSGIVGLILCFAAFEFPASIWKIGLMAVGWFFFGRSMAEKTVTLVSVTSSTGEPEKIPRGRRWAASLGMLTFAIGVFTQQWHIAIMGIVYSYLTAAAMWQNFRARLPYLYDPWSEVLPPAPTLMHAMIAISILVEGGAVLTGIAMGVGGVQYVAVAQAVSYAICAVVVSLCMSSFLSSRDVPAKSIWFWPGAEPAQAESKPWWRGNGLGRVSWFQGLLIGGAAGAALGLFALGYLVVLHHFPVTAGIIDKSRSSMAKIPGLRISYAVVAVGFAPFAEEYLFRGLLFRALDREWGGWHAVLGSAAFFAIYHQPLSWLPVGLLGVANALLFKKTGQLAPAVMLHMVYNAVVTLS